MKTKDLKGRDVVAIEDFSREELEFIIRSSLYVKQLYIEGSSAMSKRLVGRMMASLFYEDSSRTRKSFEQAFERQGGRVTEIAGTAGTSVRKGEPTSMTGKMFECYLADLVVMRHQRDGSAQWAADCLGVPLINGGDGKNQHPTQTMLDLTTMYELLDGKIDGSNIGFGGDLKFGRTIHSLTTGLSKFNNVRLHLAAPKTFGMPDELAQTLEKNGVRIIKHDSLEDALKQCDIFYMTRPQVERMEKVSSPIRIRDMISEWRITQNLMAAYPDVWVMHPLPVDSTIEEIEFSAMALPNFAAFQQARNGLFVRMALVHEVIPKRGDYSEVCLSPELMQGNNHIPRQSNYASKKGAQYLGLINNGTVIDHIPVGKAKEISDLLGHGQYSVAENRPSKTMPGKDLLKIEGGQLTSRQEAIIAIIAPEATFSRVVDGEVVEKYGVAVCSNDNCITHPDLSYLRGRDKAEKVPFDDAPFKFYEDSGNVQCRYCRSKAKILSPKITLSQREEWQHGLPKKVIPVHYK